MQLVILQFLTKIINRSQEYQTLDLSPRALEVSSRRSTSALLHLRSRRKLRSQQLGGFFTHVTIGRIRQISDAVAIKADVPMPPDLSEALYVRGSDMLSKTVTGLLSAFYEHANDLPVRPGWLVDRLNTPKKIDTIARTITGGIGAVDSQLATHFRGNDFTCDEAIEASGYAFGNANAGIYFIRADHYDGTSEIYTGHTSKSFTVRRSEYVSDINDEKEQREVIQALRRSKNWTMFPVCYINGLPVRDPVLILAEQVFVELTQSYTGKLLSYESGADFMLGDVGDDEDSQHGGSQSEGSQSDDESKDDATQKLPKVGAAILKKDTAFILSQLASKVFEKTGWKPLINLTKFGPTSGLNGQPPLIERSYAAVQWVQTEGEGFLNFRRTGHLARVRVGQNGVRRIIVFAKHVRVGGNKSTVFFEVPENEHWPAHGTPIHQAFEVDTDDTIRDHSLGYLPRVGPYSDFADAHKIRLRIEWKDENGDWVIKYFQKTGTDERVKAAEKEGETQRYSHATGLRNYLLQAMRRMPADGSLNWLTDFGLARVKKVYFDHLDWSIKAYDFKDHHYVDAPTRLSIAEIGQQLLDAGAERFVDPDGTEAFKQYADGSNLESKRSGCDLCYVQQQEDINAGSRVYCKQAEGKNQCIRCHRYGLPCTFTKTASLNANEALLNAVSPRRPLLQNYQPTLDDEMVDY